MASFESWMLPHKRRYRRIMAGYQNLYNDSGNWTGGKIGHGQQIGTNRSIAAPTLKAWRGGFVSHSDMLNLSVSEAMQIYKVNYWDRIKGDSINSQLLADILADMKSSAGGNAIKEMQRTLNDLGESLSIDGSFGSATLAALNRKILLIGEAKIYNRFRERMVAYYKSINNPYEKQLIGSLNRDYPPIKTGLQQVGTAVVVVVAVLLFSYGAYQYKLARAA